MVAMKHGTYKGSVHGDLKPGATAILLTEMLGEPAGMLKAQFDKHLVVGQVSLHLGWHQFPVSDWDIDEDEDPISQDGGPMHAHLLPVNRRSRETKSAGIPKPRKHPDNCRCMICGGV